MVPTAKNNSLVRHNDDYKQAAEMLFDAICTLLDEDINPGCVASCLIMHATRLSFASCDDGTVIFQNLLGTLLSSIPQKEPQFSEELQALVTHTVSETRSH